MDQPKIFRQAALDRLQSPEGVDKLLGVPPVRRSLILLVLVTLVASLLLWWLLTRGWQPGAVGLG
jgi:hypothetical protein